MFWKTVAPFFSCKSKVSNKIVFTEDSKLINDDLKYAEVFNIFWIVLLKN